MTKEERDFLRWMIESAKDETELFRACEVAENARKTNKKRVIRHDDSLREKIFD